MVHLDEPEGAHVWFAADAMGLASKMPLDHFWQCLLRSISNDAATRAPQSMWLGGFDSSLVDRSTRRDSSDDITFCTRSHRRERGQNCEIHEWAFSRELFTSLLADSWATDCSLRFVCFAQRNESVHLVSSHSLTPSTKPIPSVTSLVGTFAQAFDSCHSGWRVFRSNASCSASCFATYWISQPRRVLQADPNGPLRKGARYGRIDRAQ